MTNAIIPIIGTDANNILTGGTTNDEIFGLKGNDSLYGGTGADTFSFENDFGIDSVVGGEGGANDSDRLDLSALTTAVTGNSNNEAGTLLSGTNSITFSQIESLTLTNQGDSFGLTFGTATVNAGGGNDTVSGAYGQFAIFGGTGDDALSFGFAGQGLMDGGDGNDLLLGYSGTDTIFGGAGNDTIRGGGGGADQLFGGAGADTFQISLLAGTPGRTLGNATIDGGEADSAVDTITYGAHDRAVNVTYTGSETASFSDGASGGQFTGIEALVMTRFNDVVNAAADSAGVIVNAGSGNDSLTGGAGDDRLYGENGNDSLTGGAGNDLLSGGFGNDSLTGGAGADTFTFENGFGIDSVVGGEGGANDSDTLDLSALNTGISATSNYEVGTITVGTHSISFSQIENFTLTNQADNLYAGNNSGVSTIIAGAGNDTVGVQWGEAALYGGTGDDVLNFGYNSFGLLDGGDGNDVLLGYASTDTIFGGNGNDTIRAGGGGDDQLYGGTGADRFEMGYLQGTPGNFLGNGTVYGGEADTAVDSMTFLQHNRAVSLTYSDSEAGTFSDSFTSGQFTGIEAIDLTNYNDFVDATADQSGIRIFGDWGHDTVIGGAGNDYVDGGFGNDSLVGGAGDDTLDGNWEEDTMVGGAGNDVSYGGFGNDYFVAADNFGDDTVVGGEPGNWDLGDVIDMRSMTQNTVLTFTGSEAGTITSAGGVMTFSEIETVQLGAGADLVIGGIGNDAVDAGAGNDSLNGGLGDDNLSGGAGDDLFDHNLAQNTGATDVYNGGANFDELHMSVTAAEWANPLFQADVAAFLAHIASGSPAPFVFASTGLTAISIEKFTIDVDNVPIDPEDALVTANADDLSATEDGAPVAINLLANDAVPDRAGSVTLLTPSAYGSITIAANLLTVPQTAVATFTAGAGAQALGAGQVVTEVLTYQVIDVDGDVSTATLTITLTGVNDAATITGLSTGNVTEDAMSELTGSLTVSDVDTGEAVFQAPTGLAGTYGTFTFNAATGAWGYTPDANSAQLQSLAVGAQVNEQLTVKSLDGTATKTITITITGQNDAPTLQAAVLDALEDSAEVSVNLATLGDDVDSDNSGNDLVYTITGAPAVGTASINGTTLTYNGGAAFQYLAEGETATQEIEVTATDSHGATVTSTMSVTITGTNDAPEIVVGSVTPTTITALPGGEYVLSGSFNYTDLDFSNTHLLSGISATDGTYSFMPTSTATNGGIGATNWTFTFTPNAATAGTQQTITLFVTDSSGAQVSQDITFTVPGVTNNLPDVSTPISVSSYAGDGLNLLSIMDFYIDPDNDPLAASADPLQNYPGITFYDTNEISLNCDDAAYQYLTTGQFQVFSYSYLVSDGKDQTVATLEWTINGTREGIYGSAADEGLTGAAYTSELLDGGAGDDTLTGGVGDDIFAYFAAGDGFDLITDFDLGEDHIGVSASAFGGNLLAGQNAMVINNADHTSVNSGGTDGVFIFETDGTDGTLYWDVDGAMGDNAVALAKLSGVTALTQDDFYLFI